MKEIVFKRVHPDACIPEYKTTGAAGFDIALIEDVEIPPLSIKLVRTGLVIKTPEGHALIIAARGSSPVKKGVNMANSIGVVDEDYSGPDDEIFLPLRNIRQESVTLKKGDRVAQGMFIPVTRGHFTEIAEMPDPSRGGHGSTGR